MPRFLPEPHNTRPTEGAALSAPREVLEVDLGLRSVFSEDIFSASECGAHRRVEFKFPMATLRARHVEETTVHLQQGFARFRATFLCQFGVPFCNEIHSARA